MIRRGLRWGLWALALVPAYLVVAVFGAIWPGDYLPIDDTQPDHRLLLVAGPIHYDILIPLTPQTREAFAFLAEEGMPIEADAATWISVGWGSRAFYTATGSYTDLSLGTVWTAATGDDGVMRFEVFGPLEEHPKLREVWISQEQLDQLLDRVLEDLDTPRVPLRVEGFTETDKFYAAGGGFHLFRTCNTWVADTLAAIGLRMGIWTPTPYSLTMSLWWNGHLDG